MSETIWKYPLQMTDIQTVEMPAGATLLSVHNQGGQLCLWAIVDPAEPLTARSIEIVGTGNPMRTLATVSRTFIGTALVGPFVWHVFEIH